MRFLAIDLGEKRTGLALGDDATGIATPLEVIQTASRDELFTRIGRAIKRQGPDELVVGLPLNMDGSEGPAAKAARDFAGELARRCGLVVHLFDERLTSHAAEGKLDGSGLTRDQKKRRRDALAAAQLLEDFLRARSRPGEFKK